MTYLRAITVVYWVALTIGLLHPQGGALSGLLLDPGWGYPDPSHFLAFATLYVLVRASRFQARWWSSPLTLCVYAVATEAAQLVVPGRHAMLMHGLANVLGLATGAGACWLVARLRVPRREASIRSASPFPLCAGHRHSEGEESAS